MKRHRHSGSRLAAAALLFFTASAAARAQVSLMFTPQPTRTTRTVGIRNATVWTVLACNETASSLNLPEERVLMAAPALFALDHATAISLLQQNHSHDRSVVVSNLIQEAIMLSTIFTAGGLVSASPRAIVSLTLGASGADKLAAALRGQAPDLSALEADLLYQSIPLGPGACATRTVLTGLMKGSAPPSPISARIP